MSRSLPPEYGHTLDGSLSLVGHWVGNFMIQRLLGEGAMGSVYLGHHQTLNRNVAIKVLKPELAANEVLVNRFIDEARAASQIGHPGLVQIYDFGTLPDGRRYSIMEFLDGRDLDTALAEEGAQDVGRSAAIGAEVASALAAAHAKNIVHRDLKPANLFLFRDEDGAERIKVLDFGIAKLLAGETARTQAGHIVGTPEYMAPEQAQAKTNIDHRVDIYALGCLLYELLVGEPPHVGDNIPSILVAQLQDEPVPPSRRRAGIPPAFEQIVLRCLAKAPEHRFQSMDEVRMALLPYVDHSISAKPTRASRPLPPPTQPSMPGMAASRVWIIAASAVLALGVAAAIYFAVTAKKTAVTATGTGTADAASTEPIITSVIDAAPVAVHVQKTPNPFGMDNAEAIAAGKELYAGRCARCHGEGGEGDGPMADETLPPRAFAVATDVGALDGFRFQAIRSGIGEAMPGFADVLSEDESWQLVSYIHSLGARLDELVDADIDADKVLPKASAAMLKRGKMLFRRECSKCHGNGGKGNGEAAKFIARKPADLTAGVYKLRSTPKDALPRDGDIYRTITRGVGTGIMPGFPRLASGDRWAIVAYVKTLSHRFAGEKPEAATIVPPRPTPTEESISRGKALFKKSGCIRCHGLEGHGENPEFTGLEDNQGNEVSAPDFADKFDFLSGERPEDIWRTMYNGLSGVPMPMGRTQLSEEDAWNVLNWVLSLSGR